MTLRPAQTPGSGPAIEIQDDGRAFVAHWVADGLMLANLPYKAGHVEALAEEGAGLVLNMCEDGEYRPGQRKDVSYAYRSRGIEEARDLCMVDLGDHPVELFDTAVRLIDHAARSGRNAVVHCRGGRERSAAVVAAA